MSVAEAPAVERVCPSCGETFLDPSRTSPRTYCTTCRPPKGSIADGVRKRDAVAGTPFTVEHFRRWSARFRLKDGSLFELEDYQARFLEDLFGRDADGLPVFAELWLIVPEGNGKTTFLALVVLYTIEFKPEAWVPVAASARDQAVDLTYRICSGFVERNKLDGEYRLHPGYRSIIHKQSKGAVKIFASDAASGDGVDPDLAVIEELHRLAAMDLYETWAGKLDKSGGQLVVVSTAGEAGGAFEKLRTHIRQSATLVERERCFVRAVAAGVVMHEYALPEDADPDDLELVAAANPFSGKTVEALAKKRAKPSWNMLHWRRFTCNMPTRPSTAAVTEREWHDAATREQAPPDALWWLGLDVGWQWDTTAIVPFWWRDVEYRLFGPAKVIVPPGGGVQTHPDLIKSAIQDHVERLNVTTVVMDVSGARDIAAWMSDELDLTVVDRAQSNKPQVDDHDRFMEALRQGWLRHSGDEALRRHVFNAVAQQLPGGGEKFARPSQTRRGGDQDVRVIDALVAAAMVHSYAVETHTAVAAVGWRGL